MSLILDTVLAPIKPYLAAAKLALIGGAVVLIAFLGWRVHADGQIIGEQKAGLLQASSDNASLKTSLDAVTAANNEWAEKDSANKVALDELTQELQDQAGDLAGVRARLAQAQAAETSPAAVALRATRIDAADPALAQRLRAEAAANAH
jgi:hypothetical protein